MAIRRYQDFDAWKLAAAFKAQVFDLVLRRCHGVLDPKFRSQLIESARSVTNNFAEGFLKCSPGEFARYLSISIGSLGEAENHVRDGIALGHFLESDCTEFFRLGRRTVVALVRLKQSQVRRSLEDRAGRKNRKG